MDDSDPGTGDQAVASASVFDVYDDLLVPLVFEPYADDLVGRLTDLRAGSVLEVAAGTGVVTRAMAAALPDPVTITATDLIPGMVERAMRVGTVRPVAWEPADATALPYDDESFDVVVCQFGAMFFDPKADAFGEARRVLRRGGRFVFNVWDELDRNEFAATVAGTVARLFPDDPPGFLQRVPYSYHDPAAVAADLRAAGFDGPSSFERVERRSRATTAEAVASAFCAGTPLRDQLEARGPDHLGTAIAGATAALAARFGATHLDGQISALVTTTCKD